jgi:hypothetical protein
LFDGSLTSRLDSEATTTTTTTTTPNLRTKIQVKADQPMHSVIKVKQVNTLNKVNMEL